MQVRGIFNTFTRLLAYKNNIKLDENKVKDLYISNTPIVRRI